MIKKLAIMCFAAMAVLFGSCNDDSKGNNETYVMSSVAVRSFSLSADEDVLNNLDSVYFSVDLQNAKIYNADSLPMGTKINRLVVNITTVGASIAELTYRKSNDRDTTVNYLENSTDSIDFSRGPVKFHIVSLDGSASRDYEIKVNVHKQKADSLYWSRSSRRNLPSKFGIPALQKTQKLGDELLTLTSDGAGKYCLAFQSKPWLGADRMAEISFGFTPDVDSFTSTDDALYILDNAGNLYKSLNEGAAWTKIEGGWFSLLGAQDNELLGVKRDGNNYLTCSYPSGKTAAAPEYFPVKGASQLVKYVTEWSKNPVSVMVGGADNNGKLNGYAWSYDGGQWAIVSKKPIAPAEGYSLFAYEYVRTDTVTWGVISKPVIVAVGGRKADGTFNRTTYMSYDLGFNWFKGSSMMQLPEYIPGMRDAQCFVVTSIESEKSQAKAAGWQTFADAPLPVWYRTGVGTRAVKPVTQWEVPYIYMYGGYGDNSVLYNTVWRGTINRLTYKPIQ